MPCRPVRWPEKLGLWGIDSRLNWDSELGPADSGKVDKVGTLRVESKCV